MSNGRQEFVDAFRKLQADMYDLCIEYTKAALEERPNPDADYDAYRAWHTEWVSSPIVNEFANFAWTESSMHCAIDEIRWRNRARD